MRAGGKSGVIRRVISGRRKDGLSVPGWLRRRTQLLRSRMENRHGHGHPTPDAGLSEIYGEYNGITKSTGAFCFGADYQLARWFSFSLDLSAAFVWHDIYDGISRQKTGSRTGAVLCLLPQAKFVFLNRPSVRIYGKFGLGIVKYLGFDKRNWEYDYDYDYDDPPLCYVDNSLVPGFQWVPVGVEVGKKFFGFAETGIGTLYKGISAGVGYKF